MSLSTRTRISICSAAGLAAAGTSLYVHYGLVTNAASSSFCDISQTINCTQAYLSPYGEIGGVPVALAGVLYFAIVLVLASMAWKKPGGDSAPGYIFAISVPALAFIGYLAYAAFFVLHTFCILCAISYLAVIATAILSWRATAFPLSALPARASSDVGHAASSPLALVIVVILVAGTIAVAKMFSSSERPAAAAAAPTFDSLPPVSDDERGRLAKWWELQPKVDLPIDAGGAKVLVVKFNDYQCPPCRQTFQGYKPVFQKHGDQVKFVLKHFPLEPECNPAVSNVIHPAACEAAAAVNMARAKGTADRLEEWLFANQGPPLLTPDQVREAARTVGITDFAAQYPQVIKDVRADAVLGEKLKVGGTPTFFINGRMVKEILAPQYFNVLIELELRAH